MGTGTVEKGPATPAAMRSQFPAYACSAGRDNKTILRIIKNAFVKNKGHVFVINKFLIYDYTTAQFILRLIESGKYILDKRKEAFYNCSFNIKHKYKT